MDNPINMYQYSLLFDNFDSCEAKDLEKNAKLFATSAESQNVKKNNGLTGDHLIFCLDKIDPCRLLVIYSRHFYY